MTQMTFSALYCRPVRESEINITNVQLNVATGIEYNVYHLVKLLNKIDGLIFLLSRTEIKDLKKDLKEEYAENDEVRKKKLEELDQIKKELKRPYKKQKISLAKNMLPLMKRDNPKQTIVVDFGTAHSGPAEDIRIIEMLTFGTKNIGDVDKNIDRTLYRKPK